MSGLMRCAGLALALAVLGLRAEAADLSACFAPDPAPAEATVAAALKGEGIAGTLVTLPDGPTLCLTWGERQVRLRPTEAGPAKAQVTLHCMAQNKMPSAQENVLYFADDSGAVSAAIFPTRKGERHKIGLCAVDSAHGLIATGKGRR